MLQDVPTDFSYPKSKEKSNFKALRTCGKGIVLQPEVPFRHISKQASWWEVHAGTVASGEREKTPRDNTAYVIKPKRDSAARQTAPMPNTT